MCVKRGVQQVHVVELVKEHRLEYIVGRHRIVRMGPLDGLEAAQRALVIQRVEALVRRAHRGLPVQRVGMDHSLLGGDREQRKQCKEQRGNRSPAPGKFAPSLLTASHTHALLLYLAATGPVLRSIFRFIKSTASGSSIQSYALRLATANDGAGTLRYQRRKI